MMSAQEELGKLRQEVRSLRIRKAQLEYVNLLHKKKVDQLEELLRERDIFIKELEEEKEELGKLIEELKRQREVYRGMVYKPNHQSQKVSPFESVPSPLSVGGQKGHKGSGRILPSAVDQHKRVFSSHCPECHTKLSRSSNLTTHTVVDIPEPQTKRTLTTRYEKERQWCPTCQKEVIATPPEVIPHSRLGLNLITQTLIWKYRARIPFATIRQLFQLTYGIDISSGALASILRRTHQWLGPAYDTLLQEIRSSPLKHADETGWRINGVNSWVWAFLTPNTVYYTIEETRGKGVPQRILHPSKPTDVLVRDDYGGYEKLPLRQQSCWAHLLRKSHEAINQTQPSEEIKELHQKLKSLHQQLQDTLRTPFEEETRQAVYHTAWQDLQDIMTSPYTQTDSQSIQTRIKNQGQNLLTALLYEGVPLTNNLAERAIRPMVVTRKISGGSRSLEGAMIHAVNMSLLQTINQRNQPLVPTLKDLLLQGVFGKN